MALGLADATACCAAPTVWTVNSCGEGTKGSLATHAGTLRFAVANAASGDIVNMAGLSCGTISLQTGAITIAQNSLTLNGPGMQQLTITGSYNSTVEADRIINHTGGGTLAINNLSVSSGFLKPAGAAAKGGCIYSHGSVSLGHVGVYFCSAIGPFDARGLGGGVYSHGSLTVNSSSIRYNTVSSGIAAYGAGLYGAGAVTVNSSIVSANQGTGLVSNSAIVVTNSVISDNNGAGIATRDIGTAAVTLTLTGSTVSGNSVGVAGRRLFDMDIRNSTISGNKGFGVIAAFRFDSGSAGPLLKVYNSTIAYNGSASQAYAGGIRIYAYNLAIPGTVTLRSTLVAGNIDASQEFDLAYENSLSPGNVPVVAGSNNLVRTYNRLSMPGDTISGVVSCPRLGPLRANGGPTPTHALLSGSPAIDTGNNVLALAHDQSGAPFGRVSGTNADIGAYEVQQNDIVFDTNFEACPVL